MDLNQKVNSLIESPVRPPLSKAAAPSPASKSAAQQQRAQTLAPPSTRRPVQQQQQPATNFARLAVARAQQQGSQTLSAGRKGVPAAAFQPPQTSYTQQRQQQELQFDSEVDEPQQQQQQNNFDDSPVQTSTPTNTDNGFPTLPARQQNIFSGQNNKFVAPQPQPQQQQLVIQSGGGPDGSSAISTQYDTLQPIGQQQQKDLDETGQAQAAQRPAQQNGGNDNGYESSLNDSNDPANDDFRSAGAKAAASHNQNWYIMRSI